MKENKRFLSLHFELTNQCNLRCKHCYNIEYLEDDKRELSTEEVKKIIDKSVALGCSDLGFSGGEPFARSDIMDILEYSKEYPIHILTNGSLLNNDMISKLNQINDLMIEFRVSLDGLTTHKNLRNIDYRSIISNIALLLQNGYIVTVNTMVTNENILELEEMYEILKELHIDRWRIDFIFNSGNANINKLRYKDIEILLNKLKNIISIYLKEQPDFELDINKLFRSAFLENYEPIIYDLDSKPCEYQGALVVRPDGGVSYCPSMSATYGNILSDDINTITNHRKWKEFSSIKVRDLPKKCHECKYMKYCGGGCRADAYYETGDIYGISDFTCKIVAFFVENILPLIKQYKGQKK